MKKKFSISALAVIAISSFVSTSIYAQPNLPRGKSWEMVEELSDEFNGNFDTNKWQKVLWDYSGTPTKMIAENSGVSDGNLWIKATLGADPLWFQSSRIYSKAQIKYPMYTECRIITAHLSAYNTFWLNNGDINNRDEIDIIENNSRPSCNCQPDFPWQMSSQYFQVVNGNTERNKGNFDNRNLSADNPGKGVRWNEAYHVVGMWWKDANNIQFYLDGEPAGSVKTNRNLTRDLNLIWDLWTDDANFLGGVAVKSHLTDNSINTMRVDWVHTYNLVDSGNPGGPVDAIAIGGTNSVIEAEDFSVTNGTYDDVFVPFGVNESNVGINYVNSGDYADYNVNVTEAGAYDIQYLISTPMDNSQIQLLLDGAVVSTDNVVNNGGWDSYQPLNASSKLNLSVGAHVIRVNASGSETWQWNLDKIRLSKASSNSITPSTTPVAAGNASLVIEAESFISTSGTVNDAQYGGTGLGVTRKANMINYVNSGDYVDYNINVAVTGIYKINYYISSPSDQAQIQMLVDGNSTSITNVPNNGAWSDFSVLAGGNVNLSAGKHTIRVIGSGANAWQWNLDKIVLNTGNAAGAKNANANNSNVLTLSPNPSSDVVVLSGLNSETDNEIHIYDMTGAEYKAALNNDNSINVENLDSGIYFVVVTNSFGNKTAKLMKK